MEVRRLSRGAVLRRIFDLREEIGQFVEKKGNPLMEGWRILHFWWILHSTWIFWLKWCKAKRKAVTQFCDSIRAFKLGWLYGRKLSSGDSAHFPYLAEVCATAINANSIKSRLQDCCVSLRKSFSSLVNFSLTLHTQSFWCACRHPTRDNWFAMWCRFEGQVCLSRFGRILSISLIRVQRINSPSYKYFVHVWDDLPLWTSFLSNEHQ